MKELQIYEHYKSYINSVLKPYIKHFGEVKWLTVEDIMLAPNSRRISWEEKYSDPYLQKTKNSKTDLAKDILENGTYWPIFLSKHPWYDKYVVMAGYHRVLSLQQYYRSLNIAKEKQRKFLCIIMNDNHFRKNNITYKPKYTNGSEVVKLERTFFFPIPYDAQIPFDAHDTEYIGISSFKKNITKYKGNIIMFEAKNFNDIREVLALTPHWLKNHMFDSKENNNKVIIPSITLNEEKSYKQWIKGD